MNIETAVLYSMISFFYIISPGPAVFLALANGMSADMKAVYLSSAGNILGLLLLSSICIIGLGSLILTSATLFILVKMIGATYLIYLGLKQLKFSKGISDSDLKPYVSADRSNRSYFLEGFILASTNPKPILFFIAIFPQFLQLETSLTSQFLIMTLIFMSISFLTLTSYGLVAKSAKKMFSKKMVMKWFHRLTGGLFIGMGIGLLQLKSTQI